MSDIFKSLKTYSFEVYPASHLGTDYQDVTVLGTMDYQTAGMLGFDAAAVSAQVSPDLPAGIPKDFHTYTYLKLKTQSGEIRFVAEEWIRPDTIQLRDVTTAIVTIGKVSASDGLRIRAALNANGFDEIDIRFVN